MAEKISELIHSSSTLHLKIPLQIYRPKNEEHGLQRS